MYAVPTKLFLKLSLQIKEGLSLASHLKVARDILSGDSINVHQGQYFLGHSICRQCEQQEEMDGIRLA